MTTLSKDRDGQPSSLSRLLPLSDSTRTLLLSSYSHDATISTSAVPAPAPAPASAPTPTATPAMMEPAYIQKCTSFEELAKVLQEIVVPKIKAMKNKEKTLSAQAGQVLRALQTEEAMVNALAKYVKDVKNDRRKLLSKITAPKWEIRHHFHMTAFEDSLGHRQPHVMDVAEMLPGYLRILAQSRSGALNKRCMSYALNKSKSNRNMASENIADVYQSLKQTRAEIKALGIVIENIRSRTRDLPVDAETRQKYLEEMQAMFVDRNSVNSRGVQIVTPQSQNPLSVRVRYFTSLNLATARPSGSILENVHDRSAEMTENYNQDGLLAKLAGNLHNQPINVKQLSSLRKRIALENLPLPHLPAIQQINSKNDVISPSSNDSQDANGFESDVDDRIIDSSQPETPTSAAYSFAALDINDGNSSPFNSEPSSPLCSNADATS